MFPNCLVEHHYKLIVHETGACPGLLLASIEPEVCYTMFNTDLIF